MYSVNTINNNNKPLTALQNYFEVLTVGFTSIFRNFKMHKSRFIEK